MGWNSLSKIEEIGIFPGFLSLKFLQAGELLPHVIPDPKILWIFGNNSPKIPFQAAGPGWDPGKIWDFWELEAPGRNSLDLGRIRSISVPFPWDFPRKKPLFPGFFIPELRQGTGNFIWENPTDPESLWNVGKVEKGWEKREISG